MDHFVDKAELASFIINELDTHPTSVVARAARKFGISRQRVQYRIDVLLDEGVLQASGNTRARKYFLKRNVVYQEVFPLNAPLEEHVVFAKKVKPLVDDVPGNVLTICNYGLTEMLNNAIDHSLSPTVLVEVSKTPAVLELSIGDTGVGIFKKIKDALSLEDERHCLLELSKGKVTTDRERHTGEGIFFTSRAFDQFSILSGKLFSWHRTDHDDWLLEDRSEHHQGTYVTMRICTYSKTNLKEVFDSFTTEDHVNSFAKTHVPVSLAQYGDGNLVSRSQAKRVLARFDQFAEVLLDFHGVSLIGQAFADEIFRVFQLQNPDIRVGWVRANPNVKSMIDRARAAYLVDRAGES